MVLSLCACDFEKTSSERETELSNTSQHDSDRKGTRDKPYQIGDTIIINGFKAYFDSGQYADVSFDLELVINKAYSYEEGVAIRESKYDTFTAIPAANVTFTVTGNYENEMYYPDIFKIGVVDQKMQTNTFDTLDDENQKSMQYIYTNVEYTANILCPYENGSKSVTEAKYFVIHYRNADNAEEYIYISAKEQKSETNTASEEHQDVENVPEEEVDYRTARIAEEKGYYTVARKIFENILHYKDAQAHYDKMNSILQTYNGIYYGESTQYKNVRVYLYIEDGYVTAQFEGKEKSLSEYELYLYGDDSGTPILAFGNGITDLFLLNPDISYDSAIERFAITHLDDGGYLILAAEGSTSYTWNGIYEKISDSVSLSETQK